MDNIQGKEKFNKASRSERGKKHRNYTHRELVEKIDAMVSVAKTVEQKKEMLGIKDNYYVDKEKTAVNRYVRNRNFELAKRKGLHVGKTIKDIERHDQANDQTKRNVVVKKAKTYYHRNYSLSKEHKIAKEQTKLRDMTVER